MKSCAARGVALLAAIELALLAWRADAEDVSRPLVSAPSSVDRGLPLSVAAYVPGGMLSAAGELLDPRGRRVAAGRGFPVDLGSEGRSFVILLGVPTTAEPGSYVLRVQGEVSTARTFTVELPISVAFKAFRQENLSLDKSLSELREQMTPRKIAESRKLNELLARFDPSSVFQTSRFAMPLERWRITSRFGDRRRYEYSGGGTAGTIHAGIDLAASEGDTVRADGAGRVAFAGFWLVTGNTVVLEHLPGVYSLYYHMRKLLVSTGEQVAEGQPIGEVGSTGLATGPHLHWEVRIGGVAVDPQSLLETGLVDVEKIRHTIVEYRDSESEGR